jgi:hypothetical protein
MQTGTAVRSLEVPCLGINGRSSSWTQGVASFGARLMSAFGLVNTPHEEFERHIDSTGRRIVSDSLSSFAPHKLPVVV